MILDGCRKQACDSNDRADTLDVLSDAVDKRILGASSQSLLRSPGLSLDFELCLLCGARLAKPRRGWSSVAQLHLVVPLTQPYAATTGS